MKKTFLLFIKCALFIFLSLFSLLNYAANYPGAGTDRPIGVYPYSLVVRGGDGIGVSTTAEISTPQGMAWLSAGMTVVSGGAGDFVAMATPLPLADEIGLITGGSDFPVLVSDLFLSNHVTLTVGGEFETKYGRIVLNGEFDLSDQTLTFPSSLWPAKINGNGNILNFSNGGTLKHVGGTIELENLFLKGLRTASFLFTDHSQNLKLTNCVLQLDRDCVANFDFEVFGDVLVTGTHTLCLNRYLIIRDGARLTMDVGTTFSMGYPASVATESTGISHFNGCDIELGDNYGLSTNVSDGFFMRNGLVVFENRVQINDDSNSKAFTLGENCDLINLGGARIILDGTTTFSVL